jgi:protein-tyrosine kinase
MRPGRKEVNVGKMSDLLERGGRNLGDEPQPTSRPASAPPPPKTGGITRVRRESRTAAPGPEAKDSTSLSARATAKAHVKQPGFDPKKWTDPDNERLVSLWAPNSPQAKRIDILRSQLLYPFHGEPPRTILVTSAAPREGKSLLVSNLAISFARGLQQFVMVIDCQLMEPRIHELLGVPLRPGLSDYLEGKATVPEIMHWTQVERLSVIPAGSPSHLSSELLATDRMGALMEELRTRYQDRYMLLDTPSVQAFDDPAVIARQVEGIVFMVESGTTDREEVMRALSRLPEEKLVGMVLNDKNSTVSDASAVAHPQERENVH